MDFVLGPIERWLWPRSRAEDARVPRWLSVARYAFALFRDFTRGELNLRATSLVYTTMVAIVPLLALSFSAMRALGLHRSLEPLIMSVLAPIGPRAGELTERIMHSIDNVHGSMLASVSVVLLIVSALSMAQKVETSFNFVWRVDRPRSRLRRFCEYLGIILDRARAHEHRDRLHREPQERRDDGARRARSARSGTGSRPRAGSRRICS